MSETCSSSPGASRTMSTRTVVSAVAASLIARPSSTLSPPVLVAAPLPALPPLRLPGARDPGWRCVCEAAGRAFFLQVSPDFYTRYTLTAMICQAELESAGPGEKKKGASSHCPLTDTHANGLHRNSSRPTLPYSFVTSPGRRCGWCPREGGTVWRSICEAARRRSYSII